MIALLGLLAIGLALNVQRSLDLGFYRMIPWWVAAGVPAAISAMYYDIPESQTMYGTFETAYWGTPLGSSSDPRKSVTDVDDATRMLIDYPRDEIDFASIRTVAGLRGDDKGIVDFIMISYSLFGMSSSHFMNTYYVFLAISVVLLWVSFRNNHAVIFCAGAYLAILWLLQPMIAYNDQLTSLLALRAFPILSIPACLHCCAIGWEVWKSRRIDALAVLATVAQLLIILLCFHVRTTAIWQICAIILSCMPLMWLGWRRQQTAILVLSATLTLSVVGGYTAVKAYHHFGYSEIYREPENISTRVFWHNIYSGLAYNTHLASHFDIAIDDVSIMRTTGEFLAGNGREDEWIAMGGQSPGYASLQYKSYDRAVREMLVAHCLDYPLECLSAIFVDKPLATGRFLAWLIGVSSMPEEIDVAVSDTLSDIAKVQMIDLDERLTSEKEFASPWKSTTLLYLLFFITATSGSSAGSWRVACAGAGSLLVGSSATVVIGYPLPWTILDVAIGVGMFVAVLLGWGLATVGRASMLARGRRQGSLR